MVLYTVIAMEDIFFEESECAKANQTPRPTCLNEYLKANKKQENDILSIKINFDRRGQ